MERTHETLNVENSLKTIHCVLQLLFLQIIKWNYSTFY